MSADDCTLTSATTYKHVSTFSLVAAGKGDSTAAAITFLT